MPALTTSSGEFRLMAPSGFVGKIGGTGIIYGTSVFEFITLADVPGTIAFDPSFNRGGDVIGLPGIAADYSISLFGSAALLEDNNSIYTIPFGAVGSQLAFADGVRTLVYSSGSVRLGSQIIDSQPATIIAPPDSLSVPNGEGAGLEAATFLSAGTSVSLGGIHRVFGTMNAEDVTYLGGDLILDPSFNRGGDTLFLEGLPSAYSAHLSGSLVVIQTPDGHIMVPIGTTGMFISFDGEEHVLRFDISSRNVMLGDVSLSGSDATNPVSLDLLGAGADATVTLDVGTGAIIGNINLDAGLSYFLADNAGANTNVVISGFNEDDQIHVSGANAADYNFTSSDADGDSIGDDLVISFSDGSIFNLITILDVVTSSSIIFNLESAKAVLGYDFISFPDAPAAGIQANTAWTASSAFAPAKTESPQPVTSPTVEAADANISLDIGAGAIVESINLDLDLSYILTDNASKDTNAAIHGFGKDDLIQVFGVNASDYNFSSTDADGDSIGDDLRIGYSDGAHFTLITLIDAVSPTDIVANLATAEAAMGHSFISFA